MARPFLRFPPGAREHLSRMAEHGMLGETEAAQALGMPLDQFRRVIRDDKRSKQIWEDALAIERDRVLRSLHDRAVGGDVKAATTFLAVKHGLDEKTAQNATQGVQVVFRLPDAMSAETYIEQLRPALESKGEAAQA
jgi:hypothetical protein